ncbi:MAG: Phosphopantetheine adenylyltransferase [Candidatus Ordinivivax streblomastigis]|uniref:Phosphopantetheine adenylyltransferase n=1 Tax=Candidatus Ordinivivax streblomastigis TaxID=2540710 RepID=A0A5M8P560_9BACT|nr:MAG: Phosphopantetheine adenylyltransferase [Candidatus Ordinivivax streblomastigis]
MKTAIFPGTFDPFTVGHWSLVERGLQLVDEIIIAIGINPNKNTFYSLEERISTISKLYADNPQVKVQAYEGLTVDFAQSIGVKFILRGIRSINDFEYEKNTADVNRQLSGIETFVLFTEPKYTHISSSIVRELLSYGRDVGEFIPKTHC